METCALRQPPTPHSLDHCARARTNVSGNGRHAAFGRAATQQDDGRAKSRCSLAVRQRKAVCAKLVVGIFAPDRLLDAEALAAFLAGGRRISKSSSAIQGARMRTTR